MTVVPPARSSRAFAGLETPVAAWCRDVVKIYRVDGVDTPALRGITKDFPAGRLTVVAGPSGCGKSTLLRLLACVDRPTSGVIAIEGHSVGDATTRMRRRLRRRRLGYLYPDPVDNLVEYLTAAEQLRLASRLRGHRITDAEIAETLEQFGLGHRLDHRPAELSGGEQQRVSVACALVARPALVVADEPTAELDSVAADSVLDGVRVLCDAGTAFVIASHDPTVIDRADALLRLDHGRTVESW
ncbi:MAG TPA: ATP-binding cassette domain-containing protein [Jatrophihabitantaceae bacterium]|nr:ATP-binding cassette domain-containing protein [Jatrophihabitantaceae bacterium]